MFVSKLNRFTVKIKTKIAQTPKKKKQKPLVSFAGWCHTSPVSRHVSTQYQHTPRMVSHITCIKACINIIPTHTQGCVTHHLYQGMYLHNTNTHAGWCHTSPVLRHVSTQYQHTPRVVSHITCIKAFINIIPTHTQGGVTHHRYKCK